MGKCQSQESARDYGAPNEVTVLDEPTVEEHAAETPCPAGESMVATSKPSVTTQSLSEMPEHALELNESEQINIFSKLLVKNLILQECAAAEQEEKEEEMEIRSQALAVLKQVIQEECKKIDDAEADQTNVAPVEEDVPVESNAPTSNDVPGTIVEKVNEEKTSGDEAPVKKDEATAIATPCPKCKGAGKTNMMGGTRGFSFMKRQCKSCAAGTAAQAAKAGA